MRKDDHVSYNFGQTSLMAFWRTSRVTNKIPRQNPGGYHPISQVWRKPVSCDVVTRSIDWL